MTDHGATPTTQAVSQPPNLADALPRGFSDLIAGAIDLHVHGQPDLSRAAVNRGSDASVAALARQYDIRGWVLKSHLWPTMDRAAALQELFDPEEFRVFGSITLNPQNGGVSPAVVEFAAAHGATVIFFPTWGSAADVDRGGYISTVLARGSAHFDDYATANAISVVDSTGRLTSAAADVVDVAATLGLVVGTGHLSFAESTALAEECVDKDVSVFVNHPLHYATDPVELKQFTELGAYVEFAAAPLLHPDNHHTIRQVSAAIEEVGVEHTVLSTDVFSRWVPPEPEMLRMFAEQLTYVGVSAGELDTMLVRNPRRVLGIEGAG